MSLWCSDENQAYRLLCSDKLYKLLTFRFVTVMKFCRQTTVWTPNVRILLRLYNMFWCINNQQKIIKNQQNFFFVNYISAGIVRTVETVIISTGIFPNRYLLNHLERLFSSIPLGNCQNIILLKNKFSQIAFALKKSTRAQNVLMYM